MPNGCPIKRDILERLSTRQIRITPSTLEGLLHRRMPHIPRRDIRRAIKMMVQEGTLTYTNHYSTTHLELNFNQPNRVSDRITLCPAYDIAGTKNRDSCIQLQHGSSFGIGDHPTTRLCIQGLDTFLNKDGASLKLSEMSALDIGTGSAVLAMAAVKLGVGYAKGIDVDPMACNEAKINLALNGLEDRITISNTPLAEDEKETYDILLANLRPPTLKALFPLMERISADHACWMLSGFRPEEEKGILMGLTPRMAEVIWKSQSQGWSALLVKAEGSQKI